MNIKLSKRTSKKRISKSKTVKQFSKKVSKKIGKKTSKKVSKNTSKQVSKKVSKTDNNKQKIFFMEIFNNIIKVNNDQIMIIYDKEGEIWFKLKNITKLLGNAILYNLVYFCIILNYIHIYII
jgi:hypothetical protein